MKRKGIEFEFKTQSVKRLLFEVFWDEIGVEKNASQRKLYDNYKSRDDVDNSSFSSLALKLIREPTRETSLHVESAFAFHWHDNKRRVEKTSFDGIIN